MTVQAPRQGVLSRVLIAEEVNGPGSDTGITAAFLVPMLDQSGFNATQENIPVPIYTGDRTMDANLWGNITATGPFPLNWDFLFGGRIVTYFFGRGAAYARPGGGSTSLHRWQNTAGNQVVPPYFQSEYQFNDPSFTNQYIRHRGVRADSIAFKQNLKGAVTYQLQGMGTGDNVATSLIPSPVASLTNDGPFVIPDYFNGFCFINGFAVNPADFGLTLSNQCQRVDVSFNSGVAAAVNIGKMMGNGNVSLNFAGDGSGAENNLQFVTWAKALAPIPIEWWIFDTSTTGAWTKYLRVRAWVNFLLNTPAAAGNKPRTIDQKFVVASSASCQWAGEIIAPTPGPYTLPASAALGFKPDGGGTITTALGITGSQQTAAIVSALNADVGTGHFADKFVADSIGGALRVKTKTLGSTGSVQVDGTVTNTAHTAIGLNAALQAGMSSTPVVVDVLNAKGSDY